MTRWGKLVLALTASLGVQSEARAAGPGLPNLDYAPSEAMTVIGRIDATTGAPRAHGTLAMLDGYLLVVFSRDSGEADGGFALIDISNPKNPKNALTRDDDETFDIGEAHGFGMSRIGGRVYVALQASLGFQIWDFTDPLLPALVSYAKLPGITASAYATGAWWLSWQGNRVYVGGSSNGLYIVDVSDPKDPLLVDRGGPPNPIPTGYLGSFKTGPVFAFGNLLALAGMDQPGYSVLDISDPDQPTLLATRTDVTSVYSGRLYGNWLLGAGASAAGASVAVHDISDPAHILAVGEVPGVGTRGGYLSLQDDFAHIGASSNFAKVDLRVPGSFAIVGRRRAGIEADETRHRARQLVLVATTTATETSIIPHQAGKDLERRA
jgi:hypothetical protein